MTCSKSPEEETKMLADSASPKNGERSFSLALPGEIIVTVHGKPEEARPAHGGRTQGGRQAVCDRGQPFQRVHHRTASCRGRSTACDARAPAKEDVEIMRVPGSFEIPAAARMLAESGKYDAHHLPGMSAARRNRPLRRDRNECARGIGQSAQETGVPHAFGVLTCDTLEQAIDRAGLKMGNKGLEAALAAVEMANLKKRRRSSSRVASKTGRLVGSSVVRKSRKLAPPAGRMAGNVADPSRDALCLAKRNQNDSRVPRSHELQANDLLL